MVAPVVAAVMTSVVPAMTAPVVTAAYLIFYQVLYMIENSHIAPLQLDLLDKIWLILGDTSIPVPSSTDYTERGPETRKGVCKPYLLRMELFYFTIHASDYLLLKEKNLWDTIRHHITKTRIIRRRTTIRMMSLITARLITKRATTRNALLRQRSTAKTQQKSRRCASIENRSCGKARAGGHSSQPTTACPLRWRPRSKKARVCRI